MTTITKALIAGAGLAGASYATYVATTWLRYGHAKSAHDDDLLDAFMPDFDVCERHTIDVAAPAEVTLAAAKALNLDDSRIVRAIFRARELILRSKPGAAAPKRGLYDAMRAIGWGVLSEGPGEIVMGGVTKPWQANPTFRALPPAEFVAFAEPDHVKIVWTLRADPAPGGGSTFRTETRAIATDAGARTKFRLYWSLLSPGIVLIRSTMMPALKAAAERAWRIEGDDILSDARAQLTHATTIDAPPKDVWLCLLQQLAVGDVLHARPTGDESFEVIRIVPERTLVLSGISPRQGTWAFVLEPLGTDKTRLVTRYRAAYPPSAKMAFVLPAIKAIHAITERKQLRTIKHHAEHMHLS